jgi:hypothetical protein
VEAGSLKLSAGIRSAILDRPNVPYARYMGSRLLTGWLYDSAFQLLQAKLANVADW